MKWKYILAILCLALSCTLLPTGSAVAASEYDNAYHQTDVLEVRGKGHGQDCQTVDVTSSWSSLLLTDPSVGQSFATALNSGSWAVAQTKSDNGIGELDDFVRVYWTESPAMRIEFNHMFSIFYEVDLFPVGSNVLIHEALTFSNFRGVVGPQSCDLIVYNNGTSSGIYFADNFTMPQAACEIKGYVAVNVTVDYPDGYAGTLIADTPPTPSTTLHTGTLDCGGTNQPDELYIYQSGNNGYATLTPESAGRANWSYYLTSGVYSIAVVCEGEMPASPGVVHPSDGSDWICPVAGSAPFYCYLS